MSTTTDARRRLHKFGSRGNWRFKGLMLAALPSTGVSMNDVAKAWPKSGKPSDYRFLSGNPRYDPQAESERRIVQDPGDTHHKILKQYADEDGLPKTLIFFQCRAAVLLAKGVQEVALCAVHVAVVQSETGVCDGLSQANHLLLQLRIRWAF